jgi:hypothetical protein
MRKASLPALVALFSLASLASLAGCKAKVAVPAEYKDLVPEEGATSLDVHPAQTVDLGNGAGTLTMRAAGATIVYHDVPFTDVRKAFEDRASKVGYAPLYRCAKAGDVTSAKAPKSVVNVWFHDLKDTVIANLSVSDVKSVTLPEEGDCAWTDDAKRLCKAEGKKCAFGDGS